MKTFTITAFRKNKTHYMFDINETYNDKPNYLWLPKPPGGIDEENVCEVFDITRSQFKRVENYLWKIKNRGIEELPYIQADTFRKSMTYTFQQYLREME